MAEAGSALERGPHVHDAPDLHAVAPQADAEARAALAERALVIHEELTAVCLACGGPTDVLAALRRLTGGRAALVDEGLCTVAADPEEARDWAGEALAGRRDKHHPGGGRSCVILTPRSGWLVLAPVRAGGTSYGHLCLALPERPTAPDVVAAEQAAVACALVLARGEAALLGEGRHESEFVWDLLEGRVADEAEALARLSLAHRLLDLPARLVLVELGRLDERAREEGWDGARIVAVRAGAARGILDQYDGVVRGRPVVASRGRLLAVIIPVEAGATWSRPRRLGELAVAGGRACGAVTGVGVSPLVSSVQELPGAYRQAQLALTAAGGTGTVAVFEELGALQFLLAPAERSDLDDFATRVLGPLLAHDRTKSSDFVRTLEVYLDCDCNIGRASAQLFVHYKTMRNRLQRIEELAGIQLDRQRDRFDAQLALMILRLSAPEGHDSLHH